MQSITNWRALRLAVSKIHPAEGPDGFEGLAAKLFFADTNERFYLARRGDQPVGDVYSATAATALQVKRYGKTKVSEKNVEGDIDTALRETVELDFFVIVLSRTDAQLRARLAAKTRETGLDILLLELSDELSDLGALCVTYWEITKPFLPRQTAASDAWARDMANAPETRTTLERLREELRGRATRDLISGLTAQQLSRRLGGRTEDSRAHNLVDLSQAVARPRLLKLLADWWTDPQAQTAAVLQDEEGTGKTWVAAEFVGRTLPQIATAPVVFWLDSLAWAQTPTLEKLVDTALASLFLPGDLRSERLNRKIFHRWADPVLFVLDGANERGAWSAAERLLAELADRGDAIRSKFRLLFTSRDPAERVGVPRNLWFGSRIIPVGPFDDEEFAAALHQHAPGVRPEDFTQRVSEYARLPRYFQLCVRLRARLNSLHHLSKPLLLWADLQDKIENGDPQLVDIEREVQRRAADVLATLARAVGWPQLGHATITTAELDRLLPNFRHIVADLADQRVIDDDDLGEITLNSDHVVLGWALILQKSARRYAPDGFDTVIEKVGQLLEPAASNDDKVRAVCLAALLTFFDNSADGAHGSIYRQTSRAALLAWWATHHNAMALVEHLEFFVTEDVSAYVAAVEMLFRQHLPGDLEIVLVAPLSKVWRDNKSDTEVLGRHLERWLRLIYPGGAAGSKGRNETPPTRFIVAASPEQLRLSYAATSVISFRPAMGLIPALADFYRTTSFCYHDHEPGNENLRLPIKSSAESLGPLLRWSYTETVLPVLLRFADSLPRNSDELDSLRWFTRLLRLTHLPQIFGEAKDYIEWEERLPAAQANFADFRAFLNKANPDRHKPVGFGHFEWVSVRRDLPDLSLTEIATLEEDVRAHIPGASAFVPRRTGWQSGQLDDLLPWISHYSPELFATIVRDLWKVALESEYATGALLYFDELMPAADPGGELIELLLARATTLITQESFTGAVVPLTELALLHGTLDQAVAWLRAIQDCTMSRGGGGVLGLNSLPDVFARLAPAGLAEIARDEFEQNWRSVTGATDHHKSLLRTRARHWLRVYAYTAESNASVVEWALQLADENADDDHIRFDLFWIVSQSSDVNQFRRILFHPAFRVYHTGSLSHRWSPRFSSEQWATFGFEELASKTSLTLTGRFLRQAEHDTDLCRWGRVLAAKALEMIQNLPSSTGGGNTRLVVRVDQSYNLRGFGFRAARGGGESQHSISSPAWGVDRQSVRPALTQQDHDLALAQFHADLAIWRSEPRKEFMEFNAAGPLMRWSELEPAEFAAFAEAFLDQVWREDIAKIINLSSFSTVIALALLPIDPRSAVGYAEHVSNGFRMQVLTFDGALSVAVHALWDRKLNGLVAAESVRQQKLEETQNDEILLWHMLAAHANDNAEHLAHFAFVQLDKTLAQERALGVSLLAFTGNPRACERLASLVESDPSFWVREHAQWAREVCMTELACRDRYRMALRTHTLDELAAGLAEIRQAASPMAYAWHHQIERKEHWTAEPKTEAYLELFWYNWGSPSSRKENIELCGRKLKDYCRGERLKDGVTTRQSPWWKL